MKLYRICLFHSDGISSGFTYSSNARDAREIGRGWTKQSEPPGTYTIEEIEVTPTRTGIIDAMNKYAKHADNG